MPHCFSLQPTRNMLVMSIIPLPIYCDTSMVCMECSQGKKIVSMEGYLMGTPECECIHSWWRGSK